MNAPSAPTRIYSQRNGRKERSTSLEVGIAVLAYVGLMTLIMSGPLSTFTVWG